MKPALTAEQWAGRGIAIDGEPRWYNKHGEESAPSGNRHAVAALALYGQPFGFTREDVRLLEEAADVMRKEVISRYVEADRVDALADRIEALLPPAPPTEDQ